MNHIQELMHQHIYQLPNGEDITLGKARFKEMMWNLGGVTVKHYHSDNGV